MQRGSRLVELRLMESSFHSNSDQVRLEEAIGSVRVSLGRREQEMASQSFSLISPVPSENGGEDRGGGDSEGALDVEQQNQEATEVDEGSAGGSTSPPP